MENKLYFCYPAIYEDTDEYTVIEVPDLGIGPFKVKPEDRPRMADITWELAVQKIMQMINSGIMPPPNRTLEDLEVSEDNDKDAFLVELIGG